MQVLVVRFGPIILSEVRVVVNGTHGCCSVQILSFGAASPEKEGSKSHGLRIVIAEVVSLRGFYCVDQGR
jgi:hypothetical protein